MDGLFLTVEEAAAKLNLNPETIRRRIRRGKIRAQLLPGPYGDQYKIPVSELETQEAEIVPVSQLPPALMEQFNQAVSQAVNQAIEPLKEEIRQQRELLEEIKKHAETVPQIASPASSPWWKFWG